MSSTHRLTARTFLVHGLVAGLVGGVLAFVVAFAVGEPPIDDAIALEESSAAAPAAAGHSHGARDAEDARRSHGTGEGEGGGITREQQAVPGLLTATLLFGLVGGGAAGIASAFAVGRLGGLRPVASTAVVVGLAWVTTVVVPWLKYPPNPPAVGSADTLGERTALYFGFLAICILAAVAAVLLARSLLARGAWPAVVGGGVLFVVVVGVAALVMAPIDEVPDSFPANTLFSFRLGSLATSTALWVGVALTLTGLAARTWSGHQADERRRAQAAAL